jgi:hypothetical protein
MPKAIGQPDGAPYFGTIEAGAEVRVSWRARTRSVIVEITDTAGRLTLTVPPEVGGRLVQALSGLLVQHAPEPPDPAMAGITAYNTASPDPDESTVVDLRPDMVDGPGAGWGGL